MNRNIDIFYTWIRSLLFTLFLYLGTFILFFIFSPTLLMSSKKALCFPIFWSKLMSRALVFFCGIHIHIKGLENLPQKNGYIIASKHQSAMETVLFHSIVPNAFYILKRELLWLPIAGIYFLKTGCIPIDRKGGAKTMRQMLKKTTCRFSEGMNLIIFPEGTRTKPGTKEPYKPGIALLYEQCQVPVVPVALNTGYCWPKNQMRKIPGEITIHFLPIIQPGLPRRAFLDELTNRIETVQERLPSPFKEHK